MKKYKVISSISYPKVGAMGNTGSWRVFRPNLEKEKCVKCLRCWIFCPEGSIIRNKDDSITINYQYCKGCGVCASECNVKAIKMEREAKKE